MNQDLGDDLLVGANAIGAYLKRPPREIYHLFEIGQLPLFKWGPKKIAGRKSTLVKHIAALEARATEAA
jgi:hypothetical protein